MLVTTLPPTTTTWYKHYFGLFIRDLLKYMSMVSYAES